MGQVLSIFLPAWDIELVVRRGRAVGTVRSALVSRRRPPERAVLLIVTEHQQDVVARCCAAARGHGVRPGMPLAEARALVPRARVMPLEVERSGQAMALLAKWCIRFSPVVSVDPVVSGVWGVMDELADGLLLDMTGGAHLFGGEGLLLAEVAQRLGRLGFGARLAIGPTVGAAWAVARFGPHALAVVREEQVEKALAPLPVAALRLPVKVRAQLHEVGVERVGQLLKLTRESLVTRFGEEVLVRVDQAFGRLSEQVEPIHPVEPLTVRRIFEGASVQLEALFLAVQGLLMELCRELLARESGARGVRVEFVRINAGAASREILLGQPNRDARHLWNLLRPKVETVQMAYGVEAVAVTAFWVERIKHRQIGAWETGEAQDTHDQEYAGFLDTLVNRWGSKRVLAAQVASSHTPEAARRFVPVREKKEEGELLFLDRPTVMLEKPEAAEGMALQPDHVPGKLRWRGEEHVVVGGEGPERIVTAWWGKSVMSTRDYFKVKTDGGIWLWVFREMESRGWFVQGVWT